MRKLGVRTLAALIRTANKITDLEKSPPLVVSSPHNSAIAPFERPDMHILLNAPTN
jgi:hypothetical protein